MSDIDVNAIADVLNNKVDLADGTNQASVDYVIESKYPTSEDPTWYRLYKSGWLEQGGLYKIAVANNAVVNISFNKNFADTNYTITTSTLRISSTNSPVDNKAVLVHDMAINGFAVKYTRLEGLFGFSWEVKGMSAQGGI